MRVRFCLALLSALPACIENLPLASECLGTVGPCVREFDAGFGDDATDDDDPVPTAPVLDSSTLPTSPLPDAEPAQPALDAGVPLEFPAVLNRSFEFASPNSIPGDVTTLGFLLTDISPWRTCQPIGGLNDNSITAVRAETGLVAGTREGTPKVDTAPSDGKTFITIGYFFNIIPVPLLQELAKPLVEGKRYGFAIDVLATSPEAKLTFEARGNTQGCLSPGTQRALFRSTPITSTTWTTVCAHFASPANLSYLILAAEPTTGTPDLDPAGLLDGDFLGGPRLIFDNLRPADPITCPGL